MNRVTPSLIRVEADEVTYNMHILVRFELELALLRDELAAADLPAAWNDAYRRRLGVAPANDGEGVLQDVHWSSRRVRLLPDVHDRQPVLGPPLEHGSAPTSPTSRLGSRPASSRRSSTGFATGSTGPGTWRRART